MSEKAGTHLALVVSVLAILVAIFAEFRGNDRQTLERLARLEAKVEALHETCCGELNYTNGYKGKKK